jgi:hypothetical protein
MLSVYRKLEDLDYSLHIIRKRSLENPVVLSSGSLPCFAFLLSTFGVSVHPAWQIHPLAPHAADPSLSPPGSKEADRLDDYSER